MKAFKLGVLCAALMLSASPAFGAVSGVWTGAAREVTGKTYLFKLTMWSETEGVVDYPNLKCRGLVKSAPNSAGKKLFREVILEGAFGGQCADGFFELTESGPQLKWIWMSRPGETAVATGTLTRVGAAQ